MRNLTHTPFILFSVEQGKCTANDNAVHTQACRNNLQLNSIDFKEVIGFYDGKSEVSFLVVDTDKNFRCVKQIVKRFNQECILLVDQFRNATLDFLSWEDPQNIGTFQSVDSASGHNAYTVDPATSKIYVCK